MKCPHCKAKVSIFSRALNKFGKIKLCPKCNKKIKLSTNWKKLAILFVPALIMWIVFIQPLIISIVYAGPGVSVAGGVMLWLLCLQLKEVE